MNDVHAANIAEGLQAVIIPDRFNPGSQVLIVDGTPQSQVDLDHPGELHFEYVRRIGNVIDLIADEHSALTALHLGAGALTLPRYIAHIRPKSRQQVIELYPELVDFVREHLPLPKSANIRMRYGDARQVAARLPEGLVGKVNVIVSDIFRGADTPAHVSSVEYYRLLKPLLHSEGVLAVNIADGLGLNFGRASAATMAQVFEHMMILSDSSMLKGHRVGNLVLVASHSPFPDHWHRHLLASGPHPAKVMVGRELENFCRSGQIITDQTPYRGSTDLARGFFDSEKDRR